MSDYVRAWRRDQKRKLGLMIDKEPELWDLAGKMLEKAAAESKRRAAILVAETAKQATAHMILDEEKPIGDP